MFQGQYGYRIGASFQRETPWLAAPLNDHLIHNNHASVSQLNNDSTSNYVLQSHLHHQPSPHGGSDCLNHQFQNGEAPSTDSRANIICCANGNAGQPAGTASVGLTQHMAGHLDPNGHPVDLSHNRHHTLHAKDHHNGTLGLQLKECTQGLAKHEVVSGYTLAGRGDGLHPLPHSSMPSSTYVPSSAKDTEPRGEVYLYSVVLCTCWCDLFDLFTSFQIATSYVARNVCLHAYTGMKADLHHL